MYLKMKVSHLIANWNGNLKQYGMKKQNESHFWNYGAVTQSSIFCIEMSSEGNQMLIGDKLGNLK